MGLVQAKVIFPSITGLSEDSFVNDWSFNWQGPTAPSESELGELKDKLVEFYNVLPPAGSQPIAEYMSHEVSRAANACVVACYTADQLGDPLGSPSGYFNWTLGAAAAAVASLPAEVAIALSFEGDTTDVPERVGTTRPASRRRGRVYLGPWCQNALNSGGGVVAVQRPQANLLSDIRKSAQRLRDAAVNIMPLNSGLYWCVYSPTDVAVYDVVQLSTDDAFDTQRRRGTAASARFIEAVS